jgi:addiction module HigA family antidote
MNMAQKINALHPGEVLFEEFIKPLKISQYKLAKDIDVSQMKISEIVKKKRRITTDTALRLSRYFGTSIEFWLGLQNDYDIDTAMDNEELSRTINNIHPFCNNILSNA